MKFTFGRSNRLKSKLILASLFDKGSLFVSKPILLRYTLTLASEASIQAAFSVGKKRFKRAVDRNLLKRRIREVHRLNQHRFLEQLQAGPYKLEVLYIYTDKTIADFQSIQNGMNAFFDSRLVLPK